MSSRPVRLGRRVLGAGPCVVVAEAGVNHNGRLDLARRLVDAAAACGADAVKFQVFDPDLLVTAGAGRAPYQRRAGASTQREMLRALMLPPGALGSLARHARARRIGFLVTPFDLPSLDAVVAAGVPAIKLGSGEVTNLPLLRAASRSGRPVLLSTGMASLAEIDVAVDACRRARAAGLALFHCVSAYPAPLGQMNTRAVPAMAARYGLPVGLSDHSPGVAASAAAVALGAAAIEKHLTLDKTMDGPDHAASLDPGEFRELVRIVREVEASLGDGVKRCMPAERGNVRHVRRSLVAAVDIPKGRVIRAAALVTKRPAGGIPSADVDRVVGRRARRDIRADEVLTWRMVEA
ncbi:MAG: N-acetylneuraminate synthase family protein [Vicinamibacterales bacterium]